MRRIIRVALPASSQVLASLQSLLISVLIARSSTVDEFGQFGIGFAVWALCVGGVRAATSEFFIFHIPLSERTPRTSGPPLYSALALALAMSAALAIVAALVHGVGGQLVWLSATLVPFVLADATRLLLVANGKYAHAVTLDAAALGAIAIAFVLIPSQAGALAIQYGWAALALLTGIGGWLFLAPEWCRPSALWRWARTSARPASRYAADFALTSALMPIAMVVTTATAGLAGAAALRAAQVIFAPIGILARGLLIAAANPTRKAADLGDGRRVVRLSIGFSAAVGAMSLITGLVVVVMPVAFLETLLGSSAAVGQALAPVATLAAAALAVAMGAGLGLRALHAIHQAVIAKSVSAPLAVIAICIGAPLAGAAGAQAGIAAGEVLRAVWTWIVLRRQARSWRQL